MNVGELADGLQPKEISKLSAYELGEELNKIDHDQAAFTEAANLAEKSLAEAETRLLYFPDDRDAKAQAKIHRATLRAAVRQLSMLNKRQSRIQTILRTTPQ